ncbi:MAG: hypothetical protein ACOWWO_13325 [Peptococcaceae bacterium]
MFMFLEINSSIIKTALLIAYFALLLWAFGKGRQIRVKRKEKAFRKKLFKVLATEELPLYKNENRVNWSKVYTILKKTEPSPERDEVMETVKQRKSGH